MQPILLMAMDPVAGEALIKRGERIWLVSVDNGWRRRSMDGLRDVIRWTRSAHSFQVDKEFPDFDSAIEAVREEFHSRHPLTAAMIRETLAHCPPEFRLPYSRKGPREDIPPEIAAVQPSGRDEFIGFLLHELRANVLPLAALPEMMKRAPSGASPALSSKGLEILQSQVGRLLSLLDDLQFPGGQLTNRWRTIILCL